MSKVSVDSARLSVVRAPFQDGRTDGRGGVYMVNTATNENTECQDGDRIIDIDIQNDKKQQVVKVI